MKKEIFEFAKKYKMPLFLALITVLLFFGGACAPLWIVAAGLTVVFFAVCSVTEIFSKSNTSRLCSHYLSRLPLRRELAPKATEGEIENYFIL